MITISDKHNCCGCSACQQACPKQCITMQQDAEGFLYPQVDTSSCIDCGLCEKICPFLHPDEAKTPTHTYAAINNDERIRMESSSGGIFTLLAEQIINEGGVVFGARYDEEWQVTIDHTETIDGLATFRGSKYVQARVGDTYAKCAKFLKVGRKVLYSGTPCQVAGLKHYLRKEYDNLLTIEIACHGVPSPKVWKEYIKKVSGGQPLTSIVFRDKRNGWNGYGLSFVGADGKEIKYEKASNNDFMRCFLNDLCVRPSCSNCPAKAGASGADILIGDFWGIDRMHPEMHDNKGCSLVIAHTAKGKRLFKSLGAKYLETTHEEAYRYNSCIVNSSQESRYAPIFWYYFGKYGIEAAPKTLELLRNNKIRRILALIYYKYIKGRYFHTI